MNHSIRNSLSLVVLTFLAISSLGCSSLVGKKKGALDNIDLRSIKAAGYTIGAHGAMRPILTDGGQPCVVLEVNHSGRHFEKLPITSGQSIFVGDIVRDANLFKKIGRMNVVILRPNPENPALPPIRLDVDFDDKGRNVMEGQNYSLRPGDHVVVSPKEHSMLGDFFGSTALSKR
jgi:hypothetical protein